MSGGEHNRADTPPRVPVMAVRALTRHHAWGHRQ
jgi:hypothetical protein